MPKEKMPEYKTVGIRIESYNKLSHISKYNDRPMGRELAKMINTLYDEIFEKNPTETEKNKI